MFAKVVVCQVGENIAESELFHLDLENILFILISSDDRFLVLVDDKEKLYAYEIATGNVLYMKAVEKKGEEFQKQKTIKDKISRCVKLTSDNILIRLDPVTSSVCSSDLITGEHFHTLSSSKLGSEDLIAMHGSEKFIATVEKTSSDQGNEWRVWNLQTGALVSSPDKVLEREGHDNEANDKTKVTIGSSVEGLLLFGRENLFLAVIESHCLSTVKIYYLGTEVSPLPTAVPFCNLIGHDNSILEMCLAFDSSQLVTVSKDNTIKVWDLQRLAAQFCEQFGSSPNPNNVRAYYDRQTMMDSKTTKFAISK